MQLSVNKHAPKSISKVAPGPRGPRGGRGRRAFGPPGPEIPKY